MCNSIDQSTNFSIPSQNFVETDQALDGRRYKKIEPTCKERVRNLFCILFSLGIILAVQNNRFRKALEQGDLEKAANAIRWGAIACGLSAKDIRNLQKLGQINSLLFIEAQEVRNYIHLDDYDIFGRNRIFKLANALEEVPEIQELRKTVPLKSTSFEEYLSMNHKSRV